MSCERKRLAMLISGNGSTMEAIVKACRSGELDMEPVGVIASSMLAYGIQRAEKLGIPVTVIDPKADRPNFGKRLVATLEEYGADVATQNGWLPLTPLEVIERFLLLFNQHPGPLEFGGKGMYGSRVVAARLAFARIVKRDFWTEVIAQHVHPEFDKGEVVKVGRVEILPNDTVETLQKRLRPMEHRIQIAMLQDVARGMFTPVPKRESLIRPGEEELLERVKRVAIALYPQG